jgi:hypothetical protein
MPVRPSQIWKDLPAETRLAAAEAFWRDDQSQEIQGQHVEVIFAIARRLNFRPKSVQALPVERRARQLAQIMDVSDAVATRALIAYHFAAERPLMGAFLDALGLPHDNGLITADEVTPPDRERLAAAALALRGAFPDEHVALYLRTLSAVDAATWGQLDAVWPLSP